jgi:hypothetical protein
MTRRVSWLDVQKSAALVASFFWKPDVRLVNIWQRRAETDSQTDRVNSRGMDNQPCSRFVAAQSTLFAPLYGTDALACSGMSPALVYAQVVRFLHRNLSWTTLERARQAPVFLQLIDVATWLICKNIPAR